MDKLDRIVVSHMEERLLDPEQIEIVLASLLDRLKASGAFAESGFRRVEQTSFESSVKPLELWHVTSAETRERIRREDEVRRLNAEPRRLPERTRRRRDPEAGRRAPRALRPLLAQPAAALRAEGLIDGGRGPWTGWLGATVDQIEEDVADLRKYMKEVRDIVVQAGAGWKVLVAVAGFAAVLGGLAMSVIIWLWPR